MNLVIDSFGRIPQAITQGNSYDLGTYDQCINIFEQLNGVDIKGKYCVGGLAIPYEVTLFRFESIK